MSWSEVSEETGLEENIHVFVAFSGKRFIFAVWHLGKTILVASSAWQHQHPLLPIILRHKVQDEYGECRNGTENWLWKRVSFLNWLLPSRHFHILPKEKREMVQGYGRILLFTCFFFRFVPIWSAVAEVDRRLVERVSGGSCVGERWCLSALQPIRRFAREMDAFTSCLVAKSDLVWQEEGRATPPNYGEHNRVISCSLQSLGSVMRVILKPTSLDWFDGGDGSDRTTKSVLEFIDRV